MTGRLMTEQRRLTTTSLRVTGVLTGSKGDTAAWGNHASFADGSLLIAKSEQELYCVRHDWVAAIAGKSSTSWRKHFSFGVTSPESPSRLADAGFRGAPLVFLGSLLCRERAGPVGLREEVARAKIIGH